MEESTIVHKESRELSYKIKNTINVVKVKKIVIQTLVI